jgi:hypothetical protein
VEAVDQDITLDHQEVLVGVALETQQLYQELLGREMQEQLLLVRVEAAVLALLEHQEPIH